MNSLRLWLITLTIWGGCRPGHAQTPPDFISIESASYQAYTRGDWKAVQQTTRQALDNRIDYLWLRQRAGIASYRQGNYTRSMQHLNAALRFNHRDTTTLEFLYYDLLMDNQSAEALALSKGFTDSMRQRLGVKPRQGLTFLNVEAGMKTSTIPTKVGNVSYVTVGLGHRLSPAFQLAQSLTGLKLTYNQVLAVNQFQYSLRADWRVGRNWLLSPGGQYIGASGTATFNTTMRQDGWVAQLGLTRSGPGWKLSPILLYSEVSTSGTALTETGAYKSTFESQWQWGLGGEYALGPLRLLGSLEVQQQMKPTVNWHPMGNLHAQLALSRRFSVRAGYGYFNTNHFLESTSGIFNNPPDPTVDKSTLLLTGQLSKRIQAYVLGQYERKTTSTSQQTYAYQTGVGGLTMLF